jgi:hypothetical protein
MTIGYGPRLVVRHSSTRVVLRVSLVAPSLANRRTREEDYPKEAQRKILGIRSVIRLKRTTKFGFNAWYVLDVIYKNYAVTLSLI